MSALSVVAVSIGPFLDTADLATCESAQLFNLSIIEWLWDVAGSKALGSTPLWNLSVNDFLENGLRGKALISQLESLKRCVIPSNWLRPWVFKTSFCSVKVTPALTPHPHNLYDDQSEDSIMHSAKQSRTGVAVSVGTNIGQPLVIGMQFAAAGCVDDKFCIGIEAVGGVGSGLMMSISFAPFSGTCFIEYDNGRVIQTKALPSTPEGSEGWAWIHVTEKSGIRFLRQFKDGKMEDTGLLPPKMFPNWIQSYFGCIDFWLSRLAVDVDVSVEYAGCSFPSDMSIPDDHLIGIQTVWSLIGEDHR